MDEKRKTTRVEKALIVRYALRTAEPLTWDSTTIRNISAEGVLFNSNKLFAEGEILQLRFIIPSNPLDHLEVAGEVVESFVRGHGTRIKFIDLGEYEKKIIGDYVELLLKKNK